MSFTFSAPSMTAQPLVRCCAPLASAALSEEQAQALERVFKALADRHRVKILNRLLAAGGEAGCPVAFEDLLGLKQSTVSYHLKQLLDAGLIERDTRGTYSYFSLVPGALEAVGGMVAASGRGEGAAATACR